MAAQSFTSVPNSGQDDESSVGSYSTPGMVDNDVEQQPENMTPGGDDPSDYSRAETPGVSSHVGTVEDISPNDGMSMGSSTTADVDVV